MTDASRTLQPAPMEGGGSYNRNSHVQASGLLPAVVLLEDAARKATLPPVPQPIAIADYGCAEGRNSLVPIVAALAVLRSRDTARSIAVIHTDVPDNDFSALFATLTADPDSYLRDSAVFASAVGRSFYQQILPSSSVTLGWSSWSVQWLSKVPAAIPDHVQSAYSRDADARAAYERQAADDWRAFLAARELELGPGGCLVVLTMATDDDGEFGYRPLLDAMYAALAAMVTDGSLHSDELRRMAIPTVARSRAAFAAPFGDGGCFGDLSLASLDVFDGDDSIWARFQTTGDAHAFGAQWAAFSRASVFPTLAAALDDQADPVRRTRFIDALEASVAARLATAPERMRIPLARMLLVKSAGS